MKGQGQAVHAGGRLDDVGHVVAFGQIGRVFAGLAFGVGGGFAHFAQVLQTRFQVAVGQFRLFGLVQLGPGEL